MRRRGHPVDALRSLQRVWAAHRQVLQARAAAGPDARTPLAPAGTPAAARYLALANAWGCALWAAARSSAAPPSPLTEESDTEPEAGAGEARAARALALPRTAEEAFRWVLAQDDTCVAATHNLALVLWDDAGVPARATESRELFTKCAATPSAPLRPRGSHSESLSQGGGHAEAARASQHVGHPVFPPLLHAFPPHCLCQRASGGGSSFGGSSSPRPGGVRCGAGCAVDGGLPHAGSAGHFVVLAKPSVYIT